MKKLILFIFISFVSIQSFAKTQFGGLPIEYNNAIDSAKIFINKNPSKSIVLLEKALNIAIKYRSALDEKDCYKLLAKANLNLKYFDQAILFYDKAISTSSFKLKSKTNSKTKDIEILQGLALANEGKKDYPKALTYIAQIENDMAYIANANNLAWIQNAKGRIAYFQGDNAKAIKYFKYVSDAGKAITKHELVVEANDYLSKIYAQSDRKAESKVYLKNSVKAAEKLDDKKLVLEQSKKLKKAYNADKEFDKSIQLSEEVAVEEEKSGVNNTLVIDDAKTYIEQNKPDKAIPMLERSIQQSEKFGQFEEKKEAYKALSKAYEQKGNAEKALENYRKYVRLNDSLERQDEATMNNLLESQKSISEVNQRINFLLKDKELNQQKINTLESEKAFTNTLIYGLILIMCIIILSAYLLYKNIRQKKIANQLLALKSLRSQMNPHFIFNALNSVNSFISANDQRTANKYLADFSKLMRSVLENSQQDFVALSEEIEVLELYLKLEHFRFSNKFEYTFEVSQETFVEQYKVPPMLIQPYIENAVWHGLRYIETKGLLTVNIWATDKCIEVQITDNGIGRKKSQELKTHNQKKNESMGLKNIETRLAIINDIYKTDLKVVITDLNPSTGAGTKVNISIPFIRV